MVSIHMQEEPDFQTASLLLKYWYLSISYLWQGALQHLMRYYPIAVMYRSSGVLAVWV